MSDEEDTRILCKYGAECYQKNPSHRQKYKHPKKRTRSPSEKSPKKRKANTPKKSPHKHDRKRPDKNKTTVGSHNDISDSDDEKTSKRSKNSPKSDSGGSPATMEDISDELLADAMEIALSENEVLEKKKTLIKKFFLVDMPDDFYQFWEFCKGINEKDPRKAFDSIGITLVGPYDVLASQTVSENTKGEHLLHYRYYFDPPEFQTVIKGDDKKEYHIGYFRDVPDDPPVFLVENTTSKNCILNPIGLNIFSAVNLYFDHFISRANPFKRMEFLRFQKRLRDRAKELNLELNRKVPPNRKPVCKSFHTAGIVVPFDKKTDVGYRPLSVTDKELQKICDRVSQAPEESKSKSMSALQPVVTAATIAIDECDFGTGLELGINLFCYGNEFLDSTALRMLVSAYSVLDRGAFVEIAKAHLQKREKGEHVVVKY